MNNIKRLKTTPFKTALTQHVYIISDAKRRRWKVLKYLVLKNLMLTIIMFTTINRLMSRFNMNVKLSQMSKKVKKMQYLVNKCWNKVKL